MNKLITVTLDESLGGGGNGSFIGGGGGGGAGSSSFGECQCPECTRRRASRSSTGAGDGMTSRERELRATLAAHLTDVDATVGWDDVVGNADARQALQEAVEHPYTRAALHAHYGVRPARGAVLHGPPGCGKTMYAKAAAGALARLHDERVPLLSVKGPDIQSMWVGVTERTVREMFELGRLYFKRTGKQMVLFIDEADSLLPSRDGARTYGYEASTVATFLAEMDGVAGAPGVFVLLATNRLCAIDAAVLRDGRCDRVIRVRRPDATAAQQILERSLRSVPLGSRESSAERLAAVATAYFFDAQQELDCAVQWGSESDTSESGVETLTLAHVCSGAMMVGLAERAKKLAVERDAASCTMTGVTSEDLFAATRQVRAESRGLFHGDAVQELVERLGETAKLRAQLKDASPHASVVKRNMN